MGRKTTTPASEQRRLVTHTTPAPPPVSPSAIDAASEDPHVSTQADPQPAGPLLRALLGTVLPIIMITAGMVIQRSTRLAALEAEALEQTAVVDAGWAASAHVQLSAAQPKLCPFADASLFCEREPVR